LAVDGIASFVFTRWQQQFPTACFGWGFKHKITPSSRVPGTPILQSAIEPKPVYLPKGI